MHNGEIGVTLYGAIAIYWSNFIGWIMNIEHALGIAILMLFVIKGYYAKKNGSLDVISTKLDIEIKQKKLNDDRGTRGNA